MRPAARWAERRKAQGAERINRNKRFERQRETALIEVADSCPEGAEGETTPQSACSADSSPDKGSLGCSRAGVPNSNLSKRRNIKNKGASVRRMPLCLPKNERFFTPAQSALFCPPFIPPHACACAEGRFSPAGRPAPGRCRSPPPPPFGCAPRKTAAGGSFFHGR